MTTKSPRKRKAAIPGGATHVCLVLDRSGSMHAIRKDALGGVNSYIEKSKKEASLKESRLSVITFSSQRVDVIRKNEPIAKIKTLTEDEYFCSGSTPLYDAIGRGIALLDEALLADRGIASRKNGGKAVLAVMTDGLENASDEHTLDGIKQLIKDREKDGWLVIFLGEGLDVAKQGTAAGISISAPYTGGAGLRASGAVISEVVGDYASTMSVKDRVAVAKAGFSARQRAALEGKK